MAKIVSATNFYAATASNTTAAALTTLGEHATDDDIFICVGHDLAGTGAITMTTGTGWTEVVTQAASDDVRSTVFRKRVTAPETVPVFSANGVLSEEWTGTVFVVRGLNATTPVSHWHRVDVSNTNSWNSNGGVSGSTLAASSIAGPTAATFTDGQILVLHAHADTAQPLSPDIGTLTEIGKSRDAASVAHVVGFKTLNGSGTVPNVVIRGNASGATEGGVCYALVLNPATSSDTLGCATADVTVVAYLGDIGAIHDQTITWGAANARDATNGGTILGVATGSTAITPTTSTGGENSTSPWGAFTVWSTTANLGTAAWTGGIGTLTSVVDISGKMLAFQMSTTYAANAAPTGSRGIGIYLEDNASHWSFFQLRKSNTMPYPGELFTPMLDPSTALRSEGSGTLDLTNIKYIGFMVHRLAGSAASRSFSVKSILAVGKTTFFGGGTTDPTTWDAAIRCLTSWSMIGPAVRHVASTDQFQIKQNSDIGDGTNAVVFSSAATSMAFPAAWDGTVASLSDYKATVGPGGKNITLVGGTGSALVLDGSLISADSDTAVEFTVSASYDGTVSASGCTLSGYTFTDSKGLSWSGLTVQKGGTATIAGGGDLTNCTISKTTSTNAALSITGNGSVLTGCNIVVADTSITTAYHAELGAGVKEITLANQTFTGAAGTNKVHALKTAATVAAGAFVTGDHYEIKTVGTTDFTLIGASANTIGVRFTATGAGSGTGDAYAAVKITTSGTTSIAESDVTSAGAVVWVAAPELYQEVAITGLAPTYRLQLFDIEYVLTVSSITVTPTAGATYTHGGITWTVRSASITAGAGTITVYGTGTPATSGTLTKTGGTGDASVVFSAYAVGGTELYIGVPAATSYTWTDSVAAAAPRVIRVRVMEDGPGTGDAIEMIDAIVGMCGITDGTESVGYLVAAVADDVYNDRGVDGSAITGITIDDTTLRLEIASGTITNYNGTDVLVVDGRDLYAYETYWLGTTDGMRDEARFIEAIDAVNFRCSNFKLKGTSGYPIMINNCFIVDAATGIFSSMVDYSGDPISNHPEHMKAIVVSTSDSVVTGTLAEFIAAVPTAAANAAAVWSETLPL